MPNLLAQLAKMPGVLTVLQKYSQKIAYFLMSALATVGAFEGIRKFATPSELKEARDAAHTLVGTGKSASENNLTGTSPLNVLGYVKDGSGGNVAAKTDGSSALDFFKDNNFNFKSVVNPYTASAFIALVLAWAATQPTVQKMVGDALASAFRILGFPEIAKQVDTWGENQDFNELDKDTLIKTRRDLLFLKSAFNTSDDGDVLKIVKAIKTFDEGACEKFISVKAAIVQGA